MNRRYSALALSFFALGAVVLTTTDASAMLKDPGSGATAAPASAYDWPDEGSGYPGSEAAGADCTFPEDPACNVAPLEAASVQAAVAPSTSDDNGLQGVQLGASGVAGAGVALGGMWLYRRRHVLAG